MKQRHKKKRRRITVHFTDNRTEEKKMKVKTTRKAIVNGSYNVKCAGYCDLSYLLNNHSPLRLIGGVYGWNFDVYEVYGVTICTGYRNMPGARLEKISEYEEKARAILSWEDKRPFEEKQIAVENLLKEFCKLNGALFMNKYSLRTTAKRGERITKKQARAAYNNGLTVLFCR